LRSLGIGREMKHWPDCESFNKGECDCDKKYDGIHKIGRHGAIFWVGRGRDICAECKKPVKEEIIL